jgi:hypothetical protein
MSRELDLMAVIMGLGAIAAKEEDPDRIRILEAAIARLRKIARAIPS